MQQVTFRSTEGADFCHSHCTRLTRSIKHKGSKVAPLENLKMQHSA
jgi:hypothetical protein